MYDEDGDDSCHVFGQIDASNFTCRQDPLLRSFNNLVVENDEEDNWNNAGCGQWMDDLKYHPNLNDSGFMFFKDDIQKAREMCSVLGMLRRIEGNMTSTR